MMIRRHFCAVEDSFVWKTWRAWGTLGGTVLNFRLVASLPQIPILDYSLNKAQSERPRGVPYIVAAPAQRPGGRRSRAAERRLKFSTAV